MLVSITDNSDMKNKTYQTESPEVVNLNEANKLIQELWQQLREYEDRLTTPEIQCKSCVCTVESYDKQSYRHQVFDITDYQIYHGKCTCCGSASKSKLPVTALITRLYRFHFFSDECSTA